MHFRAGVYYTFRSAKKTTQSACLKCLICVRIHSCTKKRNVNSNLKSCAVWYWYLCTHLTNGIFSLFFRRNTAALVNCKTIRRLRIIWSGCADMFQTCPWSYGSQNSYNATLSNCACLIWIKEVSADRWMWRYHFEKNIFWLDYADVFRSSDLRCSDKKNVVIKRTICACC